MCTSSDNSIINIQNIDSVVKLEKPSKGASGDLTTKPTELLKVDIEKMTPRTTKGPNGKLNVESNRSLRRSSVGNPA